MPKTEKSISERVMEKLEKDALKEAEKCPEMGSEIMHDFENDTEIIEKAISETEKLVRVEIEKEQKACRNQEFLEDTDVHFYCLPDDNFCTLDREIDLLKTLIAERKAEWQRLRDSLNYREEVIQKTIYDNGQRIKSQGGWCKCSICNQHTAFCSCIEEIQAQQSLLEEELGLSRSQLEAMKDSKMEGKE